MSDKPSFFKRILDAFLNIFDSAAKKLWESLSPEQQGALKAGSGVMKIINDNIGESPEVIIGIIREKYPKVNIDSILELANQFNLQVEDKIEDAIIKIQEWLSTKEGSNWDNAMNIAAQTLSFFFSDKEARPGIIAALAEKVYRWFIK